MADDSTIIAAARLAAAAHAGQIRKYGGDPYVWHPAWVAGRTTLLSFATSTLVCVAWCHDVVEDTKVDLAQIRTELGLEVADGVAALTNHFTKDRYPEMNRTSRKREEMARLVDLSRQYRAVKLLDRTSNVLDQDPSDDFAKVYMRESEALALALGHDLPDLAGGLMRAVSKLSAAISVKLSVGVGKIARGSSSGEVK